MNAQTPSLPDPFSTRPGTPLIDRAIAEFYRAGIATVAGLPLEELARLADGEDVTAQVAGGLLVLRAELLRRDAARALLSDEDLAAMRDPVARALSDHLRRGEPEEIVLRAPDGAPVTTRTAIAMLRDGDPAMNEFVRDVYGAAVRATRIVRCGRDGIR